MSSYGEQNKSAVNILEFAKCEIMNEKAEPVRVSQLWQQQTIMFIFLRHFGCVSCRAHAVQIWENRDAYQKTGSKIIFVGNGAPHFINVFKEDLKIQDAPVYTDPTLASFRAIGFKRGFLAALGPKSILLGRKLLKEGHLQGQSFNRDTGDLWQLGGIVAIKPSGKVAYHYISMATGDFPPEKDLTGIA